jgi:hypothetical protein
MFSMEITRTQDLDERINSGNSRLEFVYDFRYEMV